MLKHGAVFNNTIIHLNLHKNNIFLILELPNKKNKMLK